MQLSLRKNEKGKELPPHLRFVESIKVRRKGERFSWRQKLLIWFWSLMVVKCVVAHWAIIAWDMPIRSIYVWGPSFAAGVFLTVAFLFWEPAE